MPDQESGGGRMQPIGRSQLLSTANLRQLSLEEVYRILRQFQVQQLDLEVQNEELRRALGEREASSSYYFDLYYLAPEGYLTLSETGIILQCNHTAATLIGVPLQDLLGMWFARNILDEDRDRFHSMRARLSKINQQQSCELRMMGNGNKQFLANLVCSAKRTVGEIEFDIVLSDITEIKRAEEVLRLTASVFNHAREGISITDPSGTIIDVNDAFTRITGYGRDEVLGQNPRILQSGRHGKEFYAAMWFDLLEKGHWSGELWNRRKSGEEYAATLTISAVRHDQGIVRQYVALFSDISERKLMEDQVRQLAFYDQLTQLPNRRLLSDRLSQTMAASNRSGLYCALMFVDLDNFKPINDAHGHGVGDLLLMEAGRRLTACVRQVDTVARFGGDEFVVMLGELDVDRTESTEQTRIVAEKIRISLAAPYLLNVQQHNGMADAVVEHHCTVSIGAVVFVNHEAGQNDILNWADAAMYQAKDAGKNAIRFYESKGQL